MTRFGYTPFVVLLFLAATAWPQENKVAVTDAAQADADFAWQGEYAGSNWGLQVVAGGNGRFDAMLYPEGLPGAGWRKTQRFHLNGALEGDTVVLKGQQYAATVRVNQADILDNAGRPLGRLTKRIRVSPTLGLRPPANGTVLFGGTNADQFINGKMTEDHLLRMGTMTKEKVGDFRLHLEFRLPYMPYARGQGRANSGVYIQQRYEVQILDSFGLAGLKNECAAMYEQQPPDVNAALPPLSWQTYDIWFRQPRWSADGKTKLEPARITVYHNGIPVHWNYALTNKTGGGKQEGPEQFPIALQDHGNPVVFRNIWMVPGQGEYPVVRPSAARNRALRVGILRRVFHRCR